MNIHNILSIILLHSVLNVLMMLNASSSQISMFPKQTAKINLVDQIKFNFELDESYSKKLSVKEYEPYDPSLWSLANAPIVLVVDKDISGSNVYSVYKYIQFDNKTAFIKCNFTIINEQIQDIQTDKLYIFKAKIMPRLVVGSTGK